MPEDSFRCPVNVLRHFQLSALIQLSVTLRRPKGRSRLDCCLPVTDDRGNEKFERGGSQTYNYSETMRGLQENVLQEKGLGCWK